MPGELIWEFQICYSIRIFTLKIDRTERIIPMSGISVSGNPLLMKEVGGKWIYWFKLLLKESIYNADIYERNSESVSCRISLQMFYSSRCHSWQITTRNYHKIRAVDDRGPLPGCMYLDFFCPIRMAGPASFVSHMKLWVQPYLVSMVQNEDNVWLKKKRNHCTCKTDLTHHLSFFTILPREHKSGWLLADKSSSVCVGLQKTGTSNLTMN